MTNVDTPTKWPIPTYYQNAWDQTPNPNPNPYQDWGITAKREPLKIEHREVIEVLAMKTLKDGGDGLFNSVMKDVPENYPTKDAFLDGAREGLRFGISLGVKLAVEEVLERCTESSVEGTPLGDRVKNICEILASNEDVSLGDLDQVNPETCIRMLVKAIKEKR